MNEQNAVLARGLVKIYPPAIGRFIIPFRPRRSGPGLKALDGVDLAVAKGSCFCLLGPNGAGKTTLIKILTTLVLPDGGRAEVLGHDVENDPSGVKKLIGCVFGDERSFYWRLSGRRNLEFFGALDGLRGKGLRSRIDELLEVTGLSEKADMRFSSYSAGMKQMLALARALISGPEVLFVDEPTRSLDPLAAAGMRTFLKKTMIAEMGKTVFLATHDLAEAEEMADTLAVINRGRIMVNGRPAALTGNGRLSFRGLYEGAVLEQGGRS